MLAAHPDNAALLNDLAWWSAQAKDPNALEYAERAYKIAPEQPAVLDTLSVLLVEKGDKARAIELLQKASKLAPASPAIRLNLAKALLAAGQRDAAKKELEELAKLGDNSIPGRCRGVAEGHLACRPRPDAETGPHAMIVVLVDAGGDARDPARVFPVEDRR